MSHLPQENAASVSEEGEGFTKIGEVLVRTEALDDYVAEKVRPLEEEIHNLKWALGIEGYENLATPEQQIGIITDLTADLAAAEERVKELEKDAKRLNYLEQWARCDPKMDGNHLWWSIQPRPTLKGESLRKAIDAAIERSE